MNVFNLVDFCNYLWFMKKTISEYLKLGEASNN
jgi:hypothetical protein